MRPQSEIRVDLSAALLDGPGTSRELAQRTGWAIGMVRKCLDNMVGAGDAVKPRCVRVHGVRRPVPVYARPAGRDVDEDDDCGGGVQDLIAVWAGLASPARAGWGMAM